MLMFKITEVALYQVGSKPNVVNLTRLGPGGFPCSLSHEQGVPVSAALLFLLSWAQVLNEISKH